MRKPQDFSGEENRTQLAQSQAPVSKSYCSRNGKSTKMTMELLKSSKTLHFQRFRPRFREDLDIEGKAKKTLFLFRACAAF
jgi:hypothetical protein